MLEIRIPVGDDLADALEAWFCEDYQQSWLLHVDPAQPGQELRGYFDTPEAMELAYGQLKAEFAGLPAIATQQQLEDKDWREAYKLHFKPWSERGLHWVPIWEKEHYALPEGDQIVYLDPGMAFGTGNHETTRLCVRRLLDARDAWGNAVQGKSVTDAGCGSGILAISAAKLGFADVFGFDNDPDAVAISQDNAALCELPERIRWLWTDLQGGLAPLTTDLLMANILANVLCEYREVICAAVRAGGRLILSGILAREVAAVHREFAPLVAARTGTPPPFDTRTDGDWADLYYAF